MHVGLDAGLPRANPVITPSAQRLGRNRTRGRYWSGLMMRAHIKVQFIKVQLLVSMLLFDLDFIFLL